jgi:predicted homoserine dehydrogenase-like protein
MIKHFHDDETLRELFKIGNSLPDYIRYRFNVFVVLNEDEGKVSETLNEINNFERPIFDTFQCFIFVSLMLDIFYHVVNLHREVIKVYELLQNKASDMLLIQLK